LAAGVLLLELDSDLVLDVEEVDEEVDSLDLLAEVFSGLFSELAAGVVLPDRLSVR
jgi:hypothetical protein